MKPRAILACIFALLFILISLPTHAIVEVTLFEPHTYERQKGKPFTETDSFFIAGLEGSGQLIIHNGGSDKKTRISSAEIWFNGNLIFGPSDFNKNVEHLVAEVPLSENNEISVKLKGKPGSYLTAQVTKEEDVDAAAVCGSGGGTIGVDDPLSKLDGTELYVPPGALLKQTVMTISSETDPNILMHLPDVRDSFLSFDLGPRGTEFEIPVSISIRYPDTDNDGRIDGTSYDENNLFVYITNGKGPIGWEALPIIFQDSVLNYLVVKTNHFSTVEVAGTYKLDYSKYPDCGVPHYETFFTGRISPNCLDRFNLHVYLKLAHSILTFQINNQFDSLDGELDRQEIWDNFFLLGTEWTNLLELSTSPAEELNVILMTEFVTLATKTLEHVLPADQMDIVVELVERITPLFVCLATSMASGLPIATCQDEILTELVNIVTDYVGNLIIDRRLFQIFNITLAQDYLKDYYSYGRKDNIDDEIMSNEEQNMATALGYYDDFNCIICPDYIQSEGHKEIVYYVAEKTDYYCDTDSSNPFSCEIDDKKYSSLKVTQIVDSVLQDITRFQEDYESDKDGVIQSIDNCPTVPNGPVAGTCTEGNPGGPCFSNLDCGTGGFCSMNQENADGDDIGDACDQCPDTPQDEQANISGCSISHLTVDLELPEDQATIPIDQYKFKWKPLDLPNESSLRYFITVKTDSEPHDIFIEEFVGYEKEIVLFGFEPGTRYFWHVRAVDQQDRWSKAIGAGDRRIFTTACGDNDNDKHDTCKPGEPGDDGKDKDCRDDDASINPGVEELCSDGIDQNCNDQIDEGCGPATHSEDFEDGELGPGFYVYGGYNITTVPDGSTGLHIYQAGAGGTNSEVGYPTSEFIDHVSADIYVSSGTNQTVQLDLHQRDESEPGWTGYNPIIYLDSATGKFRAVLELTSETGAEILEEAYLGTFNLDAWHHLSITTKKDHVIIEIDGEETNLFCGLYQRPESISECNGWVQGDATSDGGPVDYYVDNLVVHTSPLSLPTVPTPTILSAEYDDTDNENWITWDDVGADSYNLYWGTESGVTQCNEIAGNTTETQFSHTNLVPGSTYFYRVTAVDIDGNESPLSTEDSASVPGGLPTTITLPKTGQTTCYNEYGGVIDCAGTGQDGEIQAGVGWPFPRFTDNGDGTVTDNLTGLMWLKDAGCIVNVTWQGALDAVANFNANPGGYSCSDYSANYSDWSLPNIVELESLINVEESNPDAWLNNQGFNNVNSYYWSSTTLAYLTTGAWILMPDTGRVYTYYKSDALISAWPVRAGSQAHPALTWKTGQTISYAAGDDGDLERGASWPSPRFNDNGDGTITDNLTGLMWLKDPGCFSNTTWQGALDAVADFNANPGGYSCSEYSANYLDWRLPNRKELFSLIDYSREVPALSPGHPFYFSGGNYWSSSHGWSADSADMLYGYLPARVPSSLKGVWAVRAGQIGSLSDLEILYPNGGEIYYKGQDYTITWNSTNVSGNVQIDLYKGGTDPANFVMQLTDDDPNDGSYPFNPPDSLEDDHDYIIVISAESGTVWDVSNNPFAIQTIIGQLTVTLPKTGQTTCREAGNIIDCAGTGQDGEIQAGVGWPFPRFTDNGDGTVTDNLTGLMWLKDAGCIVNVTWQGALDAVADFNADPGGYSCSDYSANYSDWSLPNIVELESLINVEESNPGAWLNNQGFNNVNSYYWSSTTLAYLITGAWILMPDTGRVYTYYKSDALFSAWPVRAGSQAHPAPTWKTWQTISYAAGDDGDLEHGASWPSPRFTDNGDGTVTDNLTGLMWLKDSRCFSGTNWQGALDTVADFNADPGGYSCSDYSANYLDWRLPNRKELFSLIDYSREVPVLSPDHHFYFSGGNYWSSTPGWSADMSYGYLPAHTSVLKGVWPVRAGQIGSPNQPTTHSEDFEDGMLGPEWAVYGEYVIEDETSGNKRFHMTHGLGDPDVNSELGLWLYDEFIYHFEADIFVTPSVDQWVGLEHLWDEPGGLSQSVHLLFHTLSGEINTEYVNSKTGYRERHVLGYINANLQHSLSLTFHDDYVTVGIDGEKTNIFCGLYQKPDSLVANYSYVHGVAEHPNDVDYYVDNLVVRTSPLSLPEVPTPTNLTAEYDDTDNENWITWGDVGAASYNLYWGTESGVTQCSEFAGNTESTEFSHTGVVPGWTYYYRVASVDTDGNESALSSEDSAYVPDDLGDLFSFYQAIPTNGGRSFHSFTMNGENYLAVANGFNGSTNAVDSKIYKWNGSSFVEIQAIPTNGGQDWENFIIDGVTYLAVANANIRYDRTIDSKIYKWDETEFVEIQAIPTIGARDWESFEINGDMYLAVANPSDGSNYNQNSVIYKWNGFSFVEFQSISTHGGADWESFTIASETYLAVANIYNGSSSNINSIIYKWNGSSFVEIQAILTQTGNAWESFTIDGETYLAVANNGEWNVTYEVDSKIYKWNGSSFVEIQAIPTIGARDWESFTVDGETYLVVANHETYGSFNIDSKIYKWNGVAFIEIQAIPTNGANAWESFTIDDVTYLAVANFYNDDYASYNIDSKIYSAAIPYNQGGTRYINNDNGTVTDTENNLMWQNEDDGVGKSWLDANDYCENMSLGGFEDWRLPRVDELRTLFDYDAYDPAINSIFVNDYPRENPYSFWSASEYASLPTFAAWLVSFRFPYIQDYAKVSTLYVRCVRNGPHWPLSPSYRLSIVDNDIAIDNDSNLLWQRENDGVGRSWPEAVSHCNNLTLGGHTNWRLPTIEELQSIIDYTRNSPAVDSEIFISITGTFSFLSSTLNPINSDEVYGASLYGGRIGSGHISTGTGSCLCVADNP